MKAENALTLALAISLLPIWRDPQRSGMCLWEYIFRGDSPAEWHAAHIPYETAVDKAEAVWQSKHPR